jgi:hypothetical protein
MLTDQDINKIKDALKSDFSAIHSDLTAHDGVVA